MSEKLIRNLNELSESIKANSPSKVRRPQGSTPPQSSDMAVKVSVGKYFDALKRLAKE